MLLINSLLILMILSVVLYAALVCKAKKRWLALLIFAGYGLRVLVARLLAGGLQYTFVIDSLEYEMKAWYLLQPWMTDNLRVTFSQGHINTYNYYDHLLAAIFYLFGNHTFLAPMINCGFASLTTYILYRLRKDFLEPPGAEIESPASLCMVVLASLYPSYLVWSATNIRDPLYFLCCTLFIYSFLWLFSKQRLKAPLGFFINLLMGGFSLWLILGIRSYVVGLLLGSLGMALVIHALVAHFGLRQTLALSFALALFALFLAQTAFQAQTLSLLKDMTQLRRNFANLGFVELYARSSFDLEQSFSNLGDVLIFLPNALGHYFFGPFIWEISDTIQLLALFESLILLLLTIPTYVGIRLCYRRAPFATTVLIIFIATFSVVQSLVISNMGTIFRHRTLSILLLFIFTGEGVYEFIKKNRPSLFKA